MVIGTSSRFPASATTTGHHGSSSSSIVTSLVIPPPILPLLTTEPWSEKFFQNDLFRGRFTPSPLYIHTFCIPPHLKTGRPQLQKAVKKTWKELSKKDKKGFKSTPLSLSSQKSTIFSTRWGGWLEWLKKPGQRKFFVTIKVLSQ